jgi:hypothetical protein
MIGRPKNVKFSINARFGQVASACFLPGITVGKKWHYRINIATIIE